MSADVMDNSEQTSSKKRLSTSASLDDFDGELDGFNELESQAPLNSSNNSFMNGSIRSSAPSISSSSQQSLPQVLSSYQSQSGQSQQSIFSHSQQPSVLQEMLQSNSQASLNSPRAGYTSFSTKSPMPSATIGQNIMSPINNSLSIQPTIALSSQRNSMQHSQIRSQINSGPHSYDPSITQMGMTQSNGYQGNMASLNHQTPYGSNFPHPQQARLYNTQAQNIRGVPGTTQANGNPIARSVHYNNSQMMTAVNQRQMRQQQQNVPVQNSQQPQVRQIMSSQMVPVSTMGQMGSTQFDQVYQMGSGSTQIAQRQLQPQISDGYAVSSNVLGQIMQPSQGPHHLQNSQASVIGTLMNAPLSQQRQPGFNHISSMPVSNQQIVNLHPIEQQMPMGSGQSNSLQIVQSQQGNMITNGQLQQNIVHQKPLGTQSTIMHPQHQSQFSRPVIGGPMNSQPMSQGFNDTLHIGAGNDAPEKKKMIQQQLVLLLHAHRCNQMEKSGGKRPECRVSHCETMKRVLNHMLHCNAVRGQCPESHCASSKQIIMHWKNCKSDECPVCKPVKQFTSRDQPDKLHAHEISAASNFQNSGSSNMSSVGEMSQISGNGSNMSQVLYPTQQRALNELGSPIASVNVNNLLNDYNPMNTNPFRSSNPPNKMGQVQNQGYPNVINPDVPQPDVPNIIKDWHQSITNDLRQHLISKLVKAIFPSPDPSAVKNQRFRDLILYAKKVEKEMFEQANDKEMYYHLLAEKIYKVQKELQEKKNRRLNEQQNRTIEGSGNSSGISSQDVSRIMSGDHQYVLPQQKQPSQQMFFTDANANLQTSNSIKMEPQSQMQNLQGIKREIKQEQGSFNDAPFETSDFSDHLYKRRRLDECSTMPSTSAEITESSANESLPAKRSLTPVDVKPTITAQPPVENIIPEPKVFDANELRSYLKPILDKLDRMEDATFFRVPVDTERHGAPNYYDIIKHPMDFQTMGSKLDHGNYSNPWEFVDDMYLVFENAWKYNRKNSKPYKCSLKLYDKFQEEISPVMRQMGYCCGQKHTFTPLNLLCYGKNMCMIARDQQYYRYEVSNSGAQYGLTNYVTDKYIYCLKCFDDLAPEGINLGDDSQPNFVPKAKFELLRNDQIDPEPTEDCRICKRRWHKICANYCKNINPDFICDNCRKEKNKPKPDNKFTAKRLPHCQLSKHLEERVNGFLKEKTPSDNQTEVIIRVLCTTDKEVEVKENMKKKYASESFPEKFPYRSKAIFAFEIIDGVEVCFFGLHVQEYGSNARPPNSRRVYIAYLDSVHFFQPRSLRTDVYHELLLGYLEYVKQLGYTMAHIWACPPSEGDDYIFHCHPPQQKIPKAKRLQEWYKTMLDRGQQQRIVYEYKDIFKQARDDDLISPTALPYFEGDYWPGIIEDCIRDVEKEDHQQRRKNDDDPSVDDDEDDIFQTDDGRTVKKNSKKKNNFKKTSQKNKKKNELNTGDKVTDKLYLNLEKHKDVFFTIRLFPPDEEDNVKRTSINDPDPLMSSDLMDGRDAFLGRSRDEHWEFSSLRRAIWSTTNLCFALHSQEQKDMSYTCDACQSLARFHCTKCDDFDLCEPCFKKVGHEHPMEKITSDTKPDSNAGDREESIKRCIASLIHACQCKDANCRKNTCQKMRKVVTHTRMCKQRQNSTCPVCKQLIALCCYHAKHCNTTNCPVPFCQNIRLKLQEQKRVANRRADFLMRRRMEQLHSGMNNSSNTSQQQQQQQPPQQQTLFSASIQTQQHQSGSGGFTYQQMIPPPSPSLNPATISVHGIPAVSSMASPTPHQGIRISGQSMGSNMSSAAFNHRQPKGVSTDSPGSIVGSQIMQQTQSARTPQTPGPSSVGQAGATNYMPPSQQHIPSMNSPSVSHTNQYMRNSGQLMQSPQNSAIVQRVSAIQSPNQQHPAMIRQNSQSNAQISAQQPLYSQGMSPMSLSQSTPDTSMRQYPPHQGPPMNMYNSSIQQVQREQHAIEHHDERTFYMIAEELRNSNQPQEIYHRLRRTPKILTAFMKWSRGKNINLDYLHQNPQQQQHQFNQPEQFPINSSSQNMTMPSHMTMQQNGAPFNSPPQQWIQPPQPQQRYQQRNI